MQHITHFFLSLIDHAGYGGLFVVMTLGNIGVPVGSEIVVAAAGALAGTGHLSSVWLVGLVATLGEVIGGTILYYVGYIGGRPFVMKYGKFIKVDEKKLDGFHSFYERHGNIVVFACRFLPLVRGVSALPAGVSRMPKRYFISYTAAGSAIFCFGLAYLGSVFGRHFDEISPIIHKASTVIIAVVVVAIVAFVAERVLRARRKAHQVP